MVHDDDFASQIQIGEVHLDQCGQILTMCVATGYVAAQIKLSAPAHQSIHILVHTELLLMNTIPLYICRFSVERNMKLCEHNYMGSLGV